MVHVSQAYYLAIRSDSKSELDSNRNFQSDAASERISEENKVDSRNENKARIT